MPIPNFLLNKLKNEYNEEITKEILNGFNSKKNTAIRVNNLKTTTNTICNILKENNIKYSKISWFENGLVLEKNSEKILEKLDIYKNGEIYIQNPSSMLPPILLDPKCNEDILDMCAAPGGKTTELASLSNNESNITAYEMNKIRAEKLKYNIEKQGATRISIIEKDSRKIDNFLSFDKILLDAPCSGSGTLIEEKDNTNFTEELINKSIRSQTVLLQKAFRILKKDHILVYSTCSILKEENENIIKKLLENSNNNNNNTKAEIVPIDINGRFKDIPKLPTSIDGTLCVKPTDLYEGFFVAIIRKKSN